MTTATINIIVAAGKGTRFGSNLPKQFCLLRGRPVLMHTIEAMRRNSPESETIVVLHPEMEGFWHDLCRQYGFTSPATCHGGATRWESVKNALSALNREGKLTPATIVAIHDGARPIVAQKIMDNARKAIVDGAAGAIPTVAVTDSLRETDHGGSHSVDRSRFRAVQTPQMFRADLLWEAYTLPYRAEFTDDASVFEAAGYGSPSLTEGDSSNIKITNPIDLAIAEALLEATPC